MAKDITVSRDYFLTLLRRADLYINDFDSVIIPKDEYDGLVRDVENYKALKSALLAGGTSRQTLDILIKHSKDSIPTRAESVTSDESYSTSTPSRAIKSPGSEHTDELTSFQEPPISHWPKHSIDLSIPLTQDQNKHDGCILKGVGNFHANDFRSLTLRGIPASASLKDVVSNIKGGMLLNLYLRKDWQSAHIDFVETLAAANFFSFAKRNDVYIKDKRVEVIWADRQRYMPTGVANRIYNDGVSRNIVIRFKSSKISTDVIRSDLEHIHHLEVVDIVSEAGQIWISLNGVSHALHARSCMLTRLRYKKCVIEFYPDECAQSLPELKVKHKSIAKPIATFQRRPITISNRYNGLCVENDSNATDNQNCTR